MGRHQKVTKDELLETLTRHQGDLLKTAVELGVSVSTVYRTAKRHGIEVIQERRVIAA